MGFVKSRQIRRAYEPPRHFNGFQVLIVLLLVMAEFALGAYVLMDVGFGVGRSGFCVLC